ncbi:MAG: CGNR zinc finger domain-containing protein [Acidobacteriia bacterium]|nr:CGNR zinc finger domain-containing protein [Terriglobia bacterium]
MARWAVRSRTLPTSTPCDMGDCGNLANVRRFRARQTS